MKDKQRCILETRDGEKELLDAVIDRNTFCVEQEVNTKNNLTFTAYDWGDVFTLIDVEQTIWYNGQAYVIKQVEHTKQRSYRTKQVTATHVFFDTARFRTYRVRDGKHTYTAEELLHHYFDGNNGGYRFVVQGKFPKVEIENLGEGSLRDGVNEFLQKYEEAKIVMDNKTIYFCTTATWVHRQKRVLHEYYDTDHIDIQVDSTSVVNIVRCESDKDDKGHLPFEPFDVRDEASIRRWGRCYGATVKDNRFTHADEMRAYAQTQLYPNPTLALTLTLTDVDFVFRLGDQYVFARHHPENFTDVTVVASKYYPMAPLKAAEVTLNELKPNYLREQHVWKKEIADMRKNTKAMDFKWAQVEKRIDEIDKRIIPRRPTKAFSLVSSTTLVNWPKLRETGHTLMMIRGACGMTEDDQAKRWLQEAKQASFSVGVFAESRATSTVEAKAEATHLMQLLQQAELSQDTLIAWQFTEDSAKTLQAKHVSLSRSTISSLAEAFLKEVKEEGYEAVNYSNTNDYVRYFDARVYAFSWWLSEPNVSQPTRPCVLWESERHVDGTNRGISGQANFHVYYK